MRAIFSIIFLLIVNYCIASNWHSLGSGMNGYLNTIYIDTTTNLLYAGGYFSEADSIHCSGIAVWDGLHWDSIGSGSRFGDYMLAITKYQNQIYSDGRFFPGISWIYGGVFNGLTWDSIGGGLNGQIFEFKEINNILWVGGYFGQVNWNACPLLATWDGTNWNCFNIPYWNELDDFEFYNGSLVIGGNFFDTSNTSIDIAAYDSSTGVWAPLGGGILGGLSGVHAIQIFRGELYVAGLFSSSSGNADNNIMRWDGTQWKPVGGGTNNEIYCLNVYNDELYVGGAFTQAGALPIAGLAKWNGNQWKPVSSSVFYPGMIKDIQFWNNEMYVGGYFWTIDGTPVNNIAKYDGLIPVEEILNENSISVYPNPTQEAVNISPFPAGTTVQMSDIAGQSVSFLKQLNTDNESCQLNISGLAEGMYYVTIFYKNAVITKKILKIKKE